MWSESQHGSDNEAHGNACLCIVQDEKQALLEELAASRQRLAAAQEAAACAHKSPATSDRQLAAIEAQLHDARRALPSHSTAVKHV